MASALLEDLNSVAINVERRQVDNAVSTSWATPGVRRPSRTNDKGRTGRSRGGRRREAEVRGERGEGERGEIENGGEGGV